jgi:hypothetical protein
MHSNEIIMVEKENLSPSNDAVDIGSRLCEAASQGAGENVTSATTIRASPIVKTSVFAIRQVLIAKLYNNLSTTNLIYNF